MTITLTPYGFSTLHCKSLMGAIALFRELRIENFQAHERKRILFDPHVTTIIGPSDKGKSAIIRALRWVCLNDLRGDAFMRDGADFVRVSLLLDEGQVTRTKKGIASTYKMNGETFAALRTLVPDDIEALLNVDIINFQSQHDAPFWFALPPGQVSRELNAIVDLGVIDATMKNLSSGARDAKSKVQICTQQARDAKVELDRFIGIDAIVSDFEKLQGLESKTVELASRAIGMRRLLLDIHKHRDRQKNLTQVNTEARFLVDLAGSAIETRKRAELLEFIIDSHERNRLTSKAPNFKPVNEAKKQYDQIAKRAEGLSTLINDITRTTVKRQKQEQEAQQAQQAIHDACDGVCPLCEQPSP